MKLAAVPLLVSSALLLACSEKSEPPSAAPMALAGPTAAAPAARARMASADGVTARQQDNAPARRYLAMRHELHLRTETGGVESAWQLASAACAVAACEVLASALTRDERRGSVDAELEARMAPDKLDAFLKEVSVLGHIGQHSTTAEDKTDEVIDTDARLKNMTEFRDHLRQLMSTPGAKLKDLMEVEGELVRVQSELDSLASRRKSLASQTDKVHVRLIISALPSVIEHGMWSPVADAISRGGRLFADSLAGLITLLIMALPWATALLLGGLAFRRVWRRRSVPPAKQT